ncbi:hypothetical protein H5410_046469 [Solanum commersonii]|uniref:Uncharacterized protein n=1 Tax=Solanum commersonii TaxID=4109 RepID=A0A9J5XCC0_SOLCO|nr:hypothetical protein H5410_046469 [Solanum commersonii]
MARIGREMAEDFMTRFDSTSKLLSTDSHWLIYRRSHLRISVNMHDLENRGREVQPPLDEMKLSSTLFELKQRVYFDKMMSMMGRFALILIRPQLYNTQPYYNPPRKHQRYQNPPRPYVPAQAPATKIDQRYAPRPRPNPRLEMLATYTPTSTLYSIVREVGGHECRNQLKENFPDPILVILMEQADAAYHSSPVDTHT